MKFPQGNKVAQSLPESFGENVKTLEEHLTALNGKVWLKWWVIGLIVTCVTLFSIVASVNLALWIF